MKMKLQKFGAFLGLMALSCASYADKSERDASVNSSVNFSLCKKWSEAKIQGVIKSQALPEASGIAVSTDGKKLYHVNDSGDGARVFSSALNGSEFLEHKIEGFHPKDVEDLGMGPCGVGINCLFVADIGDNKRSRKSIMIAVLREKDLASNGSVKVYKTLKLKYADGPHNAEGFAVHPNGDIFILTKEYADKYTQPRPAKLFRLSYKAWSASSTSELLLSEVATIELPKINSNIDAIGQLATALDIHKSGSKFLVLGYRNAIEFAIDPTKNWPSRALVEGVDYKKIDLEILEQQESVSYVGGNPDQILYTTERSHADTVEVPIYGLKCDW